MIRRGSLSIGARKSSSFPFFKREKRRRKKETKRLGVKQALVPPYFFAMRVLEPDSSGDLAPSGRIPSGFLGTWYPSRFVRAKRFFSRVRFPRLEYVGSFPYERYKVRDVLLAQLQVRANADHSFAELFRRVSPEHALSSQRCCSDISFPGEQMFSGA